MSVVCGILVSHCDGVGANIVMRAYRRWSKEVYC